MEAGLLILLFVLTVHIANISNNYYHNRYCECVMVLYYTVVKNILWISDIFTLVMSLLVLFLGKTQNTHIYNCIHEQLSLQ